MIAVRAVISYRNQPKNPKAHITPMITVTIEIKVARKDLKNKKKISEVILRAAIRKIEISSLIF